MFLKLSLLLLGLSVGIAMAFRVQLSLKTNQKIQDLRGDTLVLAEQHQDVSKTCFDYYNPRLNTIVATYESSYTSCIKEYEASKELVIEFYRDIRLQLENSNLNACRTLSCCNQTANSFEAFNCTSNVAFNDAKIFYELSANATDAAEKSKSDYNRIDTQKFVCVNEAERKYVESTTLCYTELNECLLGKSVIPESTPAPSYSTPAPTAPIITDGPDY